jgi:Tol biopolymer transport system component|tara:strand:- start:771 stop:1682 length:912 start_codon:yes stop_codon:yes gene_type:complete
MNSSKQTRVNGLSIRLAILLIIGLSPFADAAEPMRLTSDGKMKQDLCFTHDTQELIYSVLKTPQLIKLQRLNLDSGTVEDFHTSANTNEIYIDFAKDMKHYAYIRNDGNLHTVLQVQDVENGELHSLNPGGGFACVRALTISPDGQNVVYSFPETNGSQQLWQTDNKLQNKTELTKSDFIDAYPRFSPTGNVLTFTSTRSGNFDIFRMSADGTGIFQLTDHPGIDTRPSFSPDGSKIVYTSLRQGNYEIFIMNADGSNQKQVTSNSGKDDFACWHPDGKRIVYVGEVKGKRDIYSISVQDMLD